MVTILEKNRVRTQGNNASKALWSNQELHVRTTRAEHFGEKLLVLQILAIPLIPVCYILPGATSTEEPGVTHFLHRFPMH